MHFFLSFSGCLVLLLLLLWLLYNSFTLASTILLDVSIPVALSFLPISDQLFLAFFFFSYEINDNMLLLLLFSLLLVVIVVVACC